MSENERSEPAPNRRLVGYLAVGFVVLAVIGLGVSWLLFSRWSEWLIASRSEANRAFTDAVTRAGGGVPYVEISDTGSVLVHRELERPEPLALRSLHLLAWEPKGERLLRVGFPFWFVRFKMSETFNLGTLTSALARDWAHLDLRVSERDLEKRGPGVVLDHRLPDGKRLLLWTE